MLNVAGLLVPGFSDVLGQFAIVGTLLTLFYAFRKKIPHPTEFWPLNIICLWLGIHKHAAFKLLIDFKTAKMLKARNSYYIFIKCGRFERQTGIEKAVGHEGICEFYQRIEIPVRQKDDKVEFILYKKGVVKDQEIGRNSVSVDNSILLYEFPKDVHLDFKQNQVRAGIVLVSFYENKKLPDILSNTKMNNSAIVQQIIIQCEKAGTPLDPSNIIKLDSKARIALFARAIEGPLFMLDDTTGPGQWRRYYFKATTTRSQHWVWCYWESREALNQKINPIGAIYIAHIAAVLRSNKHDMRHQFVLRVESPEGNRQVYFKRIDRDRNLWVEGMYIMIDLIHEDYRMSHEAREAKENSNLLDDNLMSNYSCSNKIDYNSETAIGNKINCNMSEVSALPEQKRRSIRGSMLQSLKQLRKPHGSIHGTESYDKASQLAGSGLPLRGSHRVSVDEIKRAGETGVTLRKIRQSINTKRLSNSFRSNNTGSSKDISNESLVPLSRMMIDSDNRSSSHNIVTRNSILQDGIVDPTEIDEAVTKNVNIENHIRSLTSNIRSDEFSNEDTMERLRSYPRHSYGDASSYENNLTKIIDDKSQDCALTFHSDSDFTDKNLSNNVLTVS